MAQPGLHSPDGRPRCALACFGFARLLLVAPPQVDEATMTTRSGPLQMLNLHNLLANPLPPAEGGAMLKLEGPLGGGAEYADALAVRSPFNLLAPSRLPSHPHAIPSFSPPDLLVLLDAFPSTPVRLPPAAWCHLDVRLPFPTPPTRRSWTLACDASTSARRSLSRDALPPGGRGAAGARGERGGGFEVRGGAPLPLSPGGAAGVPPGPVPPGPTPPPYRQRPNETCDATRSLVSNRPRTGGARHEACNPAPSLNGTEGRTFTSNSERSPVRRVPRQRPAFLAPFQPPTAGTPPPRNAAHAVERAADHGFYPPLTPFRPPDCVQGPSPETLRMLWSVLQIMVPPPPDALPTP
eukprot:1193166-Prorocentrum_minimum.AAC.1